MTFDLDDEDYDDGNLAEALGLPERLAPLWLPPPSELAAAARESALLRRVGELVAWMGERRPINELGELTDDDVDEVVAHLGAGDVIDVMRYWEVAVAVDLVVVSDADGEATTNPDLWPTGDDNEDLGTWGAVYRQTLMSLGIDAELADENDLRFEDMGALMLPLFLARSLGVPVVELREAAREMLTEELEDSLPWDTWLAQYGEPVDELLARLVEHGAVEIDDGTVRLTPLGMLATHEDLVDAGIDIPLLPEPEQLTTADLLTTIHGLTPEELTEVTDRWLAAQGDEKAVTELSSAAADADPAGRLLAIGMLGGLPNVPWSTMATNPVLRPYALAALEQDREPADVAWVMLDLLASTENALGELDPDAVEPTLEPILQEGRHEEVMAEAWRLPHPSTYEVLSFIGKHHPDKNLAKAARTAAHKAQSAMAGQ
ncbi:hypothetical protein [Actinophytocola sp.]|uniref:hypothetical protein n=1 Tax=Actinophytocola sp. TaxID=1872138 RepID=UPI002ED67998